MNHYQYDSLRAYAIEPLASYLGTPLAYDVARLSEKLSGGAARLEHEKSRAMEFWACPDLSPREKAAAHLLAVISNHRAISWWRAPDTPDGTDPLPALESWQEERLCKDTIAAAHAYAAFLPERQADALVALASVVAAGASDGLPDPERRLARLRELGGNAKYSRCVWQFKGIGKLVESEKSEGRNRNDEKTIRADLREAAQAEHDAKRAGFGSGLGQR